MKLTSLLAAGAAMVLATGAAAQSSTSTFENVPGGPGNPGYTTVSTADGWNSTFGIELQNHVAGNPAANGGNVFVELDTYQNSSMFRTLDAGLYSVNFLYSPRPGVGADSNVINVLLNGNQIFSITGNGGGDTNWTTQTLVPFVASAGSTLTFAAGGTSDGVGGYVDNISIAAVPEPATWAMMLLGFGMIGFGLRYRRKSQAARVDFA